MEPRTIPRRDDAAGHPDADRPLVTRSVNGDSDAFGELFVRHEQSVRRLLLSVLGPFPDIDDLTQDVFVEAHRCLGSFRGDARFSTWLHAVAVRQAYGALRKRRKKHERETAGGLDTPDTAPSTEEHALGREMVRRLYDLLADIGPKRRVALTLFAVEGYTIQEVAAAMGTTSAAAKSRIWFARRAVRKRALCDPYLKALVEEMLP